MRFLSGSIKDLSFLISHAYKACKPGGWAESLKASAVMQSDDGYTAHGSEENFGTTNVPSGLLGEKGVRSQARSLEGVVLMYPAI